MQAKAKFGPIRNEGSELHGKFSAKVSSNRLLVCYITHPLYYVFISYHDT